jgi:hypothetical protein
MRTYAEIYADLMAKSETHSLRDLVKIFETENSWIGSPFQMMKLKEYYTEITGIRVGTCSGCAIDMMRNMIRWVNRYESENPIVETKPTKKKSK